ncbi:MAG: hypothetical protein ABR592_11445, partial [Nitriliruptorales bacterium]
MGMIRTSWRRRAATTVLAGASALALAAPSVSAAPNAGPDQFAGQALSKALELEVTLPSGLTVAADGINQLISQTLTELDSQGKVAAKSILGAGDLLNESLSFTGSKKSDSKSLLALPDNPVVKLEAGKMSYTADAENRVTEALSELLNLKVGLGETDANTLIELVRERLEELVGTTPEAPGVGLNDVFKTIETEINNNLENLPAGSEPVDLPTLDLNDVAPVVVPTDAVQLPEVGDLTNLVSIEKLWSQTSTLTEAKSIVSTSEAGVIDMSLLGGLVTVPEFEFSSLAKTDGTRDGAVAEAVTKKLAVQLAGNDLISIEGDKLTVGDQVIDLGDLGLEDELGDELGQVNDLLESILNTVG